MASPMEIVLVAVPLVGLAIPWVLWEDINGQKQLIAGRIRWTDLRVNINRQRIIAVVSFLLGRFRTCIQQAVSLQLRFRFQEMRFCRRSELI